MLAWLVLIVAIFTCRWWFSEFWVVCLLMVVLFDSFASWLGALVLFGALVWCVGLGLLFGVVTCFVALWLLGYLVGC